MDSPQQALLEELYAAFNARDIPALLDAMTENVEWPNGWEGGTVHGREQVRDYWLRQWAEINPTVTPEGFAEEPDGRIAVTVHQVVRGKDDALLADQMVTHVYRFSGARVQAMEIRTPAASETRPQQA
ncbi:nuclear transport factor 2 family protein [Dactylosporangium sp. CS-047395]|uniref:nuclear transport factor 2 family protein n=1 Tax=Dactylosporangium sp. CS-047395 TaxID=3239936 RepID=UPI003D8F62FC